MTDNDKTTTMPGPDAFKGDGGADARHLAKVWLKGQGNTSEQNFTTPHDREVIEKAKVDGDTTDE